MCPEAQLSFGGDRMCATYVSGQGYYRSRAVEIIEATISAAIPADACSPLQNAPQLAGTIVLIDSGGEECPLADRVQRAQSLAALAVIVVRVSVDGGTRLKQQHHVMACMQQQHTTNAAAHSSSTQQQHTTAHAHDPHTCRSARRKNRSHGSQLGLPVKIVPWVRCSAR